MGVREQPQNRDEDPRSVEYTTFRAELLNITTIRFSVFIGLTTLYGFLFAFIATATASRLLPVLPLLLLAITFPALLINRYLTGHYRRLDSFLIVLEETSLPSFSFYKNYDTFKRIEATRITRHWPKPLWWIHVQSVYTVPLLYGYTALVLLGAFVSGVLGDAWTHSSVAVYILCYVVISAGVILWTAESRQLARKGEEVHDFKETWRILLEQRIPNSAPTTLIVLDRDGVLCKNVRRGVCNRKDFEFVEDVKEALSILNLPSFRIAVVTNQPHINAGTLAKVDLDWMHDRLRTLAIEAGINPHFFDIQFCPHEESEGCPCRKPRTQMIERAATKFFDDGPIGRVYVIGDQWSDIKAGVDFGQAHQLSALSTILIGWRFGDNPRAQRKRCNREGPRPTYPASSLLDATYWIRLQERRALAREPAQ